MMKNFFLMLWGIVLAIVVSGCVSGKTEATNDPGHFIPTEGDGNRIAIDVEILDEYETYHWPWKLLPWRGKAELYLKEYDQKKPDISLLYPLNVETNVSGTRKISVITPMEYGKPTILVFELLDDDHLDKDEVELLVEAAKTGAMIVCDAVAAYKTDYKAAEAIFNNKDRIVSLAESGATVLAKNLNKHKFDSLGTCEYKIVNKGGIFIKNPVTILNNDNDKKAHCNIYVYAIE